MSRKPPAESAVTLRDADIGSERVVDRRLLLGALGIGVAAGAILGTTGKAAAADSASDSDAAKQPAKKKKKKSGSKMDKEEETDND